MWKQQVVPNRQVVARFSKWVFTLIMLFRIQRRAIVCLEFGKQLAKS